MEGQSKEKSISCTLCSAKFTRKSNLKRHMTNIHDTNPRRHFCPFCNFKSIRNANLKRHLKLLHDADIANYDIKSEPIVDLKPSQPAPYIPPFESTTSSQHQRTKREQIYPSDEVLLSYLRTPRTEGLSPNEIPKEFQPLKKVPTPTRDEPMPPYIVKVVKSSRLTYAIKKTPFFFTQKYCTDDLPKIPPYIVQFNKNIKIDIKNPANKKDALKNTLRKKRAAHKI